jgi:voltage-gated potassium channel
MGTSGEKSMRKRIFEIIEVSKPGDIITRVYDLTMMVIICVSLLPLAFKQTTMILTAIDRITVIAFILDYFLRLMTADYKLDRGAKSFFLYPFQPMAIIDLLCILPSFTALSGGFRLLKIFRLFRTFRVFRAFKAFRYAKSVEIIVNVIRAQRQPLLAVCSLAAGYVLLSALVIFNVEPETFDTFFDAIYWATVSLTTMGYGDIYPVTTVGRLVTMISSFVGIAIVALPAGIIIAGYMEAIDRGKA